MTEFEPLTSGFGSDRSASSATTTAIKYVILPVVNWRFVTAPTSTKTICAFYVFEVVSLAINSCCICMVRILCLKDMNFMEERIGEGMIRLTVSLVTMISGWSLYL